MGSFSSFQYGCMYAFRVPSVFGMKKEENPLLPSPRDRPKKELDL